METIASGSKEVVLPLSTPDTEDKVSKDLKKCDGGLWKCFSCNLEERYDYKGTKPPFAKHLSFLEDCYIMKDPFSPPNKGEILILGADCKICENSVCMDCSLFYTKRFCKVCAFKDIKHFPLKLQNKIMQLIHNTDEEEIQK